MGQFENGPSEICERQLLKNFKFFKGCLPQISLGPFSNTMSMITLKKTTTTKKTPQQQQVYGLQLSSISIKTLIMDI